MSLKLKSFRLVTSLEINMGYCHVRLTPNFRRFCMIILLQVKYKYCWIPVGVTVAPDTFQEKLMIHSMVLNTSNHTWTIWSWQPKMTGTIAQMKSNVHSSALRRQDWKSMKEKFYSVAINANNLDYGSHYMGSNHWKIMWKPSPTSNLQKRYKKWDNSW